MYAARTAWIPHWGACVLRDFVRREWYRAVRQPAETAPIAHCGCGLRLPGCVRSNTAGSRRAEPLDLEEEPPHTTTNEWGPRRVPAYPHQKLRPPWTPESALGNESRFNTRFVSPSFKLIKPGTAYAPMGLDVESMRAALKSRCKTR